MLTEEKLETLKKLLLMHFSGCLLATVYTVLIVLYLVICMQNLNFA